MGGKVMGTVRTVREWLVGKKTYLAAGVILLAVLAGVWTGRMGLDSAVTWSGVALGLCGVSAKTARNHKELVAVVTAAAALGVAARAGGVAAVVTAVEAEAPKVVAACEGETPCP